MTTTDDHDQDGTELLHDESADFEPGDYDNVREALQEAPAGYGVKEIIDYFDPVVDGGHQVNADV